jgi:phage/plasmid-like protein (TIGR03299 family)
MAHMVETMAYAGAVPWHGLGVPVSNDLSPREIQLAAGLDWTVSKAPLKVDFNGHGQIVVEGQYGLQRSSDGKVLTIVGDIYKPVQPEQALDFFSEFVKAGDMKMETAGSLDGGRRIWALAALGEGFTLAGGDRVDGYLLLHSPYRVGESFQCKFTGVRVVCANTAAIALGDYSQMAQFRMGHAKAFDADMQRFAKEKLGLAHARMNEYREKAEFLSQSRIDGSQVLLEYVAALSGSKILDAMIDQSEADSAIQNGGSVLDAIIQSDTAVKTTRAIRESDLNRVGRTILEAICDSPGSDLESAKGTWWGAVNGVTYSADHLMGRSDDTRMTSAWFGPRAQLKQQAVSLAVQYATGKAA